MIESVVLGTMTMNAGKGIPGSTIRWALKNQFKEFARVVVVDGDLTDEAKAFYSQFSNVEVIDSPWTDSYVTQYRAFADKLKEGQYGLWLDDDEILSEYLLWGLSQVKCGDADIVKLPCVLYMTENGKDYYPAEPAPAKTFIGQWTKSILFRKNEGLSFRYFGSHVIPMNSSKKETYINLPYYHMKSAESFVYNDVWQAFLSPEGQQYTPAEAAKFRMFVQSYKNTKQFKEATKKGTWPPPLKKFAWENRNQYNRPISRLAWVYYILEGHTMPERDEFMLWNNIKQYVQSPENMKIYLEHKKNNKGIVIDE